MKKQKKRSNFDGIASSYDRLSRIIFGKSITKAQNIFLPVIPEKAYILILGGGTGDILKKLDGLDKPLKVTFIDSSYKMIEIARQHAPFTNLDVEFVHSTHDHLRVQQYDVVITAFFLDVFEEEQLLGVMQKIQAAMTPGSYWLFTDFISAGIFWQQFLVWAMYRFFRLVAGLEGSRLLDFTPYFEQIDAKLLKEKRFYRGMISARLYKI